MSCSTPLPMPSSHGFVAPLPFHASPGRKQVLLCMSVFRSGQRSRILEKRWQQFFSDPSQWWDNRPEKLNARYPDFKHKEKRVALWVEDELNPLWVEAELAGMPRGTVQKSTFSWNGLLAKYFKAGQYEKTVELFREMLQEGTRPDTLTFIPVLDACARLQALDDGRYIHTQIVQNNCESDARVSCHLVNMYAKCGSLENARTVFNKMPSGQVISWNAMIFGYVRCGQAKKALELYKTMQHEGVKADNVTFLGLLKACANVLALEEGRCVHTEIIASGFESDACVSSSLVDMYVKCGSIEDASSMFNRMSVHDVVSWNTIILGHAKCGQGRKALELYREMQREGMDPDPGTFVAVLNACASVAAYEEGMAVHRQIIERGCECNIFVSNSLVDMYTKCGCVEDASRVFDRMPKRDVITWNVMILGYAKCGQWQKALELSQQMQQEGVSPDRFTFVGVLNACAGIGALAKGRSVHRQAIESGCECDIFVGNSLIDMYAKCGRIQDAWRVFNKMPEHNVVSWNVIIMGHVRCGQGKKALELSRQMLWEGVEPDSITLSGVFNACASVVAHEGRGTEDAWRVFNKIPLHNLVSWNAMILGHVKCGQAQKALELSRQMQQEGVEPDRVTYVGVLNACASVGSLKEGRDVHARIIESGCETDLFVVRSLIDMYAKCGSIEEAWKVFSKLPTHGVVPWNSMIQGHVQCGQEQKALELSLQIESEGKACPVIFAGALNACASAGVL